MEKQDVKKILLILQAEYPERYKKTDKPTMQMTAEMWYQTTLPYPYEIVINAVTAYIAGPDCRYAPEARPNHRDHRGKYESVRPDRGRE